MASGFLTKRGAIIVLFLILVFFSTPKTSLAACDNSPPGCKIEFYLSDNTMILDSGAATESPSLGCYSGVSLRPECNIGIGQIFARLFCINDDCITTANTGCGGDSNPCTYIGESYDVLDNFLAYDFNINSNQEQCQGLVNQDMTSNEPEVFFNNTRHDTTPVGGTNYCCGDQTTDVFWSTQGGTESGMYLCSDQLNGDGSYSWKISVSSDRYAFGILNNDRGDSVISASISGWYICDATGTANTAGFNTNYTIDNFGFLKNTTTFTTCPYPYPQCLNTPTPNTVPCCYYDPWEPIDGCSPDSQIDFDSGGCIADVLGTPIPGIEVGSPILPSDLDTRGLISDFISSGTIYPSQVSSCSYFNGLESYDVCNQSAGEICEFGRNYSTLIGPDEVCCVGQTAKCNDFTTNVDTCENYNFVPCGENSNLWSCRGFAQQVLVPAGDPNGTVCCDDINNCVLDEQEAFVLFGQENQNDRIICSQFDGENYFVECCNEYQDCYNYEQNMIASNNKDRNVVAMGASLNQIYSKDYVEGTDPDDRVYNYYRNLSWGATPRNQRTPFIFIPPIPLSNNYDMLEFRLYFDGFDSNELRDSNIVVIYSDASNDTYKIQTISNKHVFSNTWLKISVPSYNSLLNLSQIRVIFPYNVIGKYLLADSLTLKSSTNTNLREKYCTPINTWIDELDLDPATISAITDFATWKNTEIETYIEHKWTCNLNPGYGWTGTRCCGDDQDSANVEYYTDFEGGCWYGYQIGQGQTLAQKEYNNPQISGRTMYFDQSFRQCGYSSGIPNAADPVIMSSTPDNYCANNWEFFCDYGLSHYKPSKILESGQAKYRNTTKTLIFSNLLFDGGFQK